MLVTGKSSVFNEDKDDEELIRDLFKRIDANSNGTISAEEMHKMLATLTGDHQKELAAALESVVHKHFKADATQTAAEISFETFLEAVREVPRVRGERVHWASALHLDAEFARFLPKGDLFDGLFGIKSMTDQEADEVCVRFGKRVRAVLQTALEQLRKEEVTNAVAFKNSQVLHGRRLRGQLRDPQGVLRGA